MTWSGHVLRIIGTRNIWLLLPCRGKSPTYARYNNWGYETFSRPRKSERFL